MSIKTLATTDHDFFVEPGDFVRVIYTRSPRRGELCTINELTSTILEVEIEETFHISTVKIVEFKNEFGLERGLAVILGE